MESQQALLLCAPECGEKAEVAMALFLAATSREHCIPVLGSITVWEGLEFWNNSYDFWSFGCLRDNMHCWCPFLMCFPSSSSHGEAEMTKKFKQRWRESRNLGTGPSGLVQASLICSLKVKTIIRSTGSTVPLPYPYRPHLLYLAFFFFAVSCSWLFCDVS